jgi:ABC-type multidrug transport system fused ATPase/permease subunit
MGISRLIYLLNIKLIIDLGFKKGNRFLKKMAAEEVEKNIKKLNSSLINMQIFLVTKLVLYIVVLLSALIINKFLLDSTIPMILISCIYILLFVLFIYRTVKWIIIYRENRELIKEYLPRYLKAKKGRTNKEALVILLNNYIDKKIVDKSEENSGVKKVLFKVLNKFKRKSKKIQMEQESLCRDAVEEISSKINEILKKRFILYFLTAVLYILIIFLSNEFVIKYYYDGSGTSALIYPFKYVIESYLN